MAKKIYAADDDLECLNLIKTFLNNDGYDVETFENGDKLYAAFIAQACDLVILDIMMPGSDGIAICQKIRQVSKVPIILLTAKDSDDDYSLGIAYGSDDYITKPFRPTLLNLRVKAILRRIEMERGQEKPGDITAGGLYYDSKKHCVFSEGKHIRLTKNEMLILMHMMVHMGEAITREKLLEVIWGNESDVETRAIDETIRRVRKKLIQAESSTVIKTVWGYGYSLEKEK